jgi:hypothetical protein
MKPNHKSFFADPNIQCLSESSHVIHPIASHQVQAKDDGDDG